MKNIFFKVFAFSDFWNPLWEFRKEFIAKALLTIVTICLAMIVIFPAWIYIDLMPQSRIFFIIVLAFLLTSIRAWYNDLMLAIDLKGIGKTYKAKPLRSMLPTYLLNYPVIILLLYFVISGLPIPFWWQKIVAFIAGWSIDEIWCEGRLLTSLTRLFRR